MTQEEKQLLLTDLWARLLYGVNLYVEGSKKLPDNEHISVGFIGGYALNKDGCQDFLIEDILEELDNGSTVKPYLRPMSSMTEEEKRDILQSLNIHGDIDNEGNLLLGTECNIITLKVCKKYLGELNKRMFDVCHMIEKNLALEAPEGMYKTE